MEGREWVGIILGLRPDSFRVVIIGWNDVGLYRECFFASSEKSHFAIPLFTELSTLHAVNLGYKQSL